MQTATPHFPVLSVTIPGISGAAAADKEPGEGHGKTIFPIWGNEQR